MFFDRVCPILILSILLPAPNAQAEQPGLKLKLQPALIPYSEGRDEDAPVFVDAERLEGNPEQELHAVGSARLRKRGAAIFANEMQLLMPGQRITATGDVRFEKDGDILRGERFYYDLEQESGYLDKPIYQLRRFRARGTADRIVAVNSERYTIENATYTNCDVGDDDWYLRFDKLDLDRQREIGVARDTTVVFKGVPILYSPYLDFSLSGRRKSGLLPPTIGTTGQNGFEITQPFYWNIAPNYDATIAPRLLSKRGVLLNTEARYLQPDLNGEFRGEWLPDDRIVGGTRYGYSWQHQQNFGLGFTGSFNVQAVSDDTYFTDISDNISATSQTNLPREAILAFNGGWWDLSARVQRFQTLQDPLAPVTPPYARAPQIVLNANRQLGTHLDMGLKGEFVDFDHPTLLNGQRRTLYPSLSLPLQNDFFFFTPKVGFHTTQYSFDDPNLAEENRQVPIYSLDSGMIFERETKLAGIRYLQTLEPRLYYLNIPFRPQSHLPNFDTAEADFSLAQIFSENHFVGGDRINDADQLTAAVTSRLIDPDNGAEQMRLILGQRFYFKEQEVSLTTEQRLSNRSDLLAVLNGRIAKNWHADIGFQYGANEGRMERSHSVFRYQPEIGKVVNLGYRFTRDSLEQLDASAQWPLSGRWIGLARWNHSLRDKRLLEGLAGLEYNAGCWAWRFVMHRFVSSTQEYVNALFLQLELNGVSRIGASPLDLLRQNVTGYAKTNEPPSIDYNPFPEY